MTKYFYRNQIKESFELDPSKYEIGTTFEDSVDGKWVKLTSKQEAFLDLNPGASAREVFNMVLNVAPTPTPEELLADAKRDLVQRIRTYDTSDNVNAFYLKVGDANSEAQVVYISPEKRVLFSQSINNAILLKEPEVEVNLNGMFITLPVTSTENPEKGADYILAQISRYFDKASIITDKHLVNANAVETVEEAEKYDYKTGYPEKITVIIPVSAVKL